MAFITKDSGKRKQFSSGMKRDTNEGKLRPDLVYQPVAELILESQPILVDFGEKALLKAYDLVSDIRKCNLQKNTLTHSNYLLLSRQIVDFSHIIATYVDMTYGFDKYQVLKRVAEVMTRGAEKYDEWNWTKAEGQEELYRFCESFLRHLYQFVLVEDKEEDHLAAVYFNLGGIIYLLDKMRVFVE